MTIVEGSAAVAVGIDAAVVANHHIVVRGPEAGRPGTVLDDFVVPPTLAGMERFSKRLVSWPAVMAVAEPTSMTWLPLAIALGNAWVERSLVGNRHPRVVIATTLRRASTGSGVRRARPLATGAFTVATTSLRSVPVFRPRSA